MTRLERSLRRVALAEAAGRSVRAGALAQRALAIFAVHDVISDSFEIDGAKIRLRKWPTGSTVTVTLLGCGDWCASSDGTTVGEAKAGVVAALAWLLEEVK